MLSLLLVVVAFAVLFIQFTSAQSVVQVEIFNDSSCLILNGSKPFAVTGVCQDSSPFQSSLVDDGFASNIFTCTNYIGYPFSNCQSTWSVGSATLPPTLSGVTY